MFKTTSATDFKFDTRLRMGNAERAGAQIIFPKSGRGLGHVAHTISIDFFSDSGQNNTMLKRIVVRAIWQSLLT